MNTTPLHMIADSSQRAYRIAFLICEFIAGTIDETELTELNSWLKQDENNQILFAELTNPANIRNEIQQRLN